ncbi:MAG: hypothetical protein FJY97_17195 [candidate division Zixibacteria bacterium]|nr:hypothetical protein [candidate division Zixibacteria bacterium]
MSRTLELPDALYELLKQAAEAEGTTPEDWLKTHLCVDADVGKKPVKTRKKPQTLADLFSGRVGIVRSGDKAALSEACGDRYTDYLE